jgi:hypothetical protein
VQGVSVSARLAPPGKVGPARFTVCPAAKQGVCSIAKLPANRAFEMQLSVPVGARLAAGRYVTVNVVAQAPGVSPAQATVSAAVAPSAQPSGSSTPASIPAPAPQATVPPLIVPAPPVSTITPANLPPLFPTVTPSPTATSQHHDPPVRHRARASLTSATLPINLRLVGGQLAGLAVLAAAIIMVIARLSLRTPRPAGRGAGEQAGTPPQSGETQ